MLFFARAAVCIGLVASALPAPSPAAAPRDGAGSVGAGSAGMVSVGAATLARLCHMDAAAPCGSALRGMLVAEPAASRPRRLRDQPSAGRAPLPRPAQVL